MHAFKQQFMARLSHCEQTSKVCLHTTISGQTVSLWALNSSTLPALIIHWLGEWMESDPVLLPSRSPALNSNAVCICICLPLHARLNLQTVTMLLSRTESCWQHVAWFTAKGIFQVKYNGLSVCKAMVSVSQNLYFCHIAVSYILHKVAEAH